MIEIQTIEHIRARPGMYIGNTSSKGFYQMLEYLFSEVCSNRNTPFEIELIFENEGWIAIDFRHADTSWLEKWIKNDSRWGMDFRGLGIQTFIALTSEMKMEIQLADKTWIIKSTNGVFQFEELAVSKNPGTVHMRVLPDNSIFRSTVFNFDVMVQHLRRYAFLTPLSTLVCRDSRSAVHQCKVWSCPFGVANELDYQIDILDLDDWWQSPLLKKHLSTTIGRYDYQVSFAMMRNFTTSRFCTFANYQVLNIGGALKNGVINGIARAFNFCMQAAGSSNRVKKSDLKNRLLLVAVVKNENFDFVFRGSTRGELYSPEIQRVVSKFVFEELKKEIQENPEVEKLFRNKYF